MSRIRSASASASFGSLTFCLCFATWDSMAWLITLTFGTNKITVPQQHVIAGNPALSSIFFLVNVDTFFFSVFNYPSRYCIKIYAKINIFSYIEAKRKHLKQKNRLFPKFERLYEDTFHFNPDTPLSLGEERFYTQTTTFL